ncbi:MAG: UDP-N-acetylmuramate dehydrogenase [Bacillota bacterium]|nr:UDP-N-acetylmuramate dehydrogenase [Bacillota bacterium]
MDLKQELMNFAKEYDCLALFDEPMSKHTTFKIGGNADVFIKVSNIQTLQALIELCKTNKISFFILGKGSNLLVSDEGLRKVVIQLAGDFSAMKFISHTEVYCGAGISLSALCIEAREHSLSGIEFAFGIPGSVGGAVYMNAGAYGSEIKDVIKSVTVLNEDGKVEVINSEHLNFSYRHSIFCENNYIILGATLILKEDYKEEIGNRMDGFMSRRKDKQPLEYPSAGSVFKRPEGNYAGTLIESCGLKGKQIGGACVSEKHAGFIINKGDATCNDVCRLIEEIKNTVKEQSGYDLEQELKVIG